MQAVALTISLGWGELRDLLASLHMRQVPHRSALVEEARRFLPQRGADFNGEITDRVLWSYISRRLTNYNEILEEIRGKVGESELYENVKVYLCCRIIRHYGLQVDPLYAAFGSAGSYGRVPERFIVVNVEAAAAEIVLQELLGSSDAIIRLHPSIASRS